MQKGQIYIIRNIETNECYVGQTLTHRKNKNIYYEFGFKKRFQEHIQHAISGKSTSPIAKSLLNYGKDNFELRLIEECDIDEIDDKERYYIDYYNTLYPNGYNVLYGPPYCLCEKSREKASKTLIEYFKESEHRVKHSIIHRGNHKTIDKEVKSIEIRPIKKNGIYDIVYLMITYIDNTEQRRRYGGIHEEYESALCRCLNDANIIVNNDLTKIIMKTDRLTNLQKNTYIIKDSILKVKVSLQSMGGKKIVSVYLVSDDTNIHNKRYSFGGKNISINEAYTKARQFTDTIINNNTEIIFNKALLQHFQIAGSP